MLKNVLLPAPATSKCTAVSDNRRSTYSGCSLATRVDITSMFEYGVSTVTRCLQMVLNAADLVVGAGKFDHVAPVLRDVLHTDRLCLNEYSSR